jgi:prevent-host-death family protein
MPEVGIRALKQNASAVVADAAAGTTITITDRGRAVAQLSALPSSRLQQLISSGRARPPRTDIRSLGAPDVGPSVSTVVLTSREDERY